MTTAGAAKDLAIQTEMGVASGRSARATIETVQDALSALAGRYRTDEVLTAIKHIPARAAQFVPMPEWVRPELAAAYRCKGIRELYAHQGAAADLARAGKDFVVVTPTASGKTLCYNLPVLNAILEDTDTRALYLFPTKALAQDQLAELHDLATRLDDCFGVFTYDGDTPSDARKAIRERGHVILTNPDMLHTGILPHHTKWTRVFENFMARSPSSFAARRRLPIQANLRRSLSSVRWKCWKKTGRLRRRSFSFFTIRRW
jgi:ATP-dependent helicase YprA (DUF1998 family)